MWKIQFWVKQPFGVVDRGVECDKQMYMCTCFHFFSVSNEKGDDVGSFLQVQRVVVCQSALKIGMFNRHMLIYANSKSCNWTSNDTSFPKIQ